MVAAEGQWTAPAEGWDEGEPLRRWWAYDAEGSLLATSVGEHFTPPEGAARIRVNIGLEVELEQDVGAATR